MFVRLPPLRGEQTSAQERAPGCHPLLDLSLGLLHRAITLGKVMARFRDAARPFPPHPGRILRDNVLPGLGLSVSQAARELRIARQTLHRVLAGTVSVAPEMAARLARLSGTTATFWLTLQQHDDLWRVEKALSGELKLIPTHTLSNAAWLKTSAVRPTLPLRQQGWSAR